MLDDTSTVHNVGVINVCEQLLQILGAKRHVAFAEHDQFCILMRKCLLETAIDTSAVTRVDFLDDQRAGFGCQIECLVLAVIVDDDHTPDERMNGLP